MKHGILAVLCLLCLTGASLPGLNEILGPHQTAEGVVFRCYQPGAKKVMIAGDWTDWEPTIRLIEGKQAGYFEGLVPLFKEGRYRYRLVIDNLWVSDPGNPKRSWDLLGDEISWFEIEDQPLYRQSPEKVGPNLWRFFYRDPEAKNLALVGSFNRYNPYEAPLTRDKLGVWTVTVQVFPGEHYYNFVVDGHWVTDPERTEKAYNRFGKSFSYFVAD